MFKILIKGKFTVVYSPNLEQFREYWLYNK